MSHSQLSPKNPKVWGPTAWSLLYSTAAWLSNISQTPKHRTVFRTFARRWRTRLFPLLVLVLPCIICRCSVAQAMRDSRCVELKDPLLFVYHLQIQVRTKLMSQRLDQVGAPFPTWSAIQETYQTAQYAQCIALLKQMNEHVRADREIDPDVDEPRLRAFALQHWYVFWTTWCEELQEALTTK